MITLKDLLDMGLLLLALAMVAAAVPCSVLIVGSPGGENPCPR